MSYKNLVIINNEKISKEKDSVFCDNIDIKSIPEDLNKNFNVTLIARSSKIQRKHKIDLRNIKISSNILTFLLNILKTLKMPETRYLVISITPYTFFSYILLFLFRKRVFVYLRSNGYEEYKAILGLLGPTIYHVMFSIVTFKSDIISCQKRLFTKRKSEIVFPSEINSLWFKNINKPQLDKPRLLYVGRLKIEKGIFSLLKIFDEMTNNVSLSIVGKKEKELKNDKVNFIGDGYDASKLIKIYDDHNIFILPSFTEAHPKVLDESLARARPVIIFEEIKHVTQNKEGVFVSKRNIKSLLETINFIMKNYLNIQEKMVNNNKLPTKEEFISKMSNILSSN
tara:strand:+ start:446 stop:1465 length:1020 start_codon:yes stop_codon:yes gene_type:complete